MKTLRLWICLVAPTLLVAWAMFGLRDLRWAFLLYVFGACGLVPWLVLGARPFSAGADGLPWARPDQRRGLTGWALFALLLFGPGFLALYALIRQSITAPEPYMQALVDLGWNPEFQTLYLLMFVAFVPLFEEWWWRGQALPRCEQAFGCRAGVVIAALGFASYHLVVLWALYDPALAFLRWTGITIGGLVWTFIAHRQRSWHWTWVAHFAADAAIVVAFLLWIQK